MRILLVSQYFWPETFRINELVEALAQRESVTVMTGKPNYPGGKIFSGYTAAGIQYEDYSEAKIVRFPLIPRACNSPVLLTLNYISFVISGLILSPFVFRKKSFDIVFVYATSPLIQAIPAVFISWLKGIPLIVWVQDLWPESIEATGLLRNRYMIWIVSKLVSFIYRRTDLILVQSPAFIGPVSRQGAEIAKIQYFPNHAEEFSGRKLSNSSYAQGVANEIKSFFSVVFTGNLGIAQSLETIVEAAEILKSDDAIMFFVIGSGRKKEWLKSEREKRRLHNIRLVDPLPPTDLPIIFSAASSLLVTLRDCTIFEYTVPSKLQTYLAAGKPIIAALNGEGAKIVSEAAAGISCAAEDSIGLAKSILHIKGLPVLDRKEMGLNGRAYAKRNYDLEVLTAELINHFREIARKV